MNGDVKYKVVGISAGQFGPGPAGDQVEGHKVQYQLEDGTQSAVFIPDNLWGLETAKAAIEAHALRTLDIRNLGNLG
jgi:hypothetical protein